MALDIVVKAIDQASPIIEKINGAIGGLANLAGGALTAGLGAATAGLAALGAGLAYGVAQAIDAEKAMAQTEAVIKSTGGAAGMTADEIADLASQLSATSTFADDAIQQGENLLLTFTNIGKEVFPEATQALVDMAAAMGTDVKGGAIQLGKALNDPIAGIAALSRVGVTFTDEQKKVIEQLVKTGDVAGAQKVILAELNKEFGGSAAAAANTFGGRLQQLQNRIDGVAETIGGALLPILTQLFDSVIVPALPAIESFAENLANALTVMQDGEGAVNSIAGGLSNLFYLLASETGIDALNEIGDAAAAVPEAFNSLSASLSQFLDMVLERGVPLSIALRSSFGDLVPPEVATTIGALSAAFQEHTELIQRAVEGLATYVLEQFALMDDTLLTNVTTALTALADFWSTWGDEIIMIVTGLVGIIITTIAGAMTLFSGIIAATLQLINGDWEGAWATMGETLTTFMNQALALVDTNLAAVQASWEGTLNLIVIAVTAIFTNIVNAVTTAMTNFMNEVKKGISAALAAASEFVSQASEVGTSLINAMIEGVVAAAGGLAQAAISAVQNALSAAGGALSGATGTGGPGVGGGNAPAFGGGSGGGGGGGSTTNNTLVINTPVAPAIPYEFQQAAANAGGR